MQLTLGRFLAQLTLLIYLIPSFTNAQHLLFTEIEKHANNSWTVSYQSPKPIKAIAFASSPDDSRLQRWQPISPDFTLSYVNTTEIITRKDGASFTAVNLRLTPTYIHLPKNYAPFSPFSNGAMLVHSARFFACPNLCSGNENLWAMAVKAPLNDTIIADGQISTGRTSWWDKNDGQKIYIGRQDTLQNASYVSIVDPKLANTVGKQLQQFLPKMMSLLENSYGALDDKPMLFASFSKTHDGNFGRQGGTLTNQVFMHWYGSERYQERDPAATLWFFAHEAAHMYQHMVGKAISSVDNWLHEGHAEMMAKKIMLHLLPQYKGFVEKKVLKAQAQCLEIIATSSLAAQIEEGNYQSLYDCGLHIFNTIENGYSANDATETLWLALMKQATIDNQVKSEVLLTLANNKYGLSEKSADNFRKLVAND